MIIIPKASFFHFTGDFIVGDRMMQNQHPTPKHQPSQRVTFDNWYYLLSCKNAIAENLGNIG